MSADSHTVCPSCHPDLQGVEGITENLGRQLGYPAEVRESYEYYIMNGDVLVFEYRALCWACGWTFEAETHSQLTGMTDPEKA